MKEIIAIKWPLFFLTLFPIIFLTSCGNGTTTSKKRADTTSMSAPAIVVPGFDADSAYYFVARQLSFGPRVPGTSAHAQCAKWLEETMKQFTPDVIVQEFKARVYNSQVLGGKNIIAVFNPQMQRRILLAAHWDSRPYADHDPDPANHGKAIDGANDGASGVGVLLEIARQLSRQSPSAGVDIILFDLEDYGPPQDKQTYESTDMWGLGSQHWARNPHVPRYTANFGILLDMVGAPNARFPMEGFSMYYAPDINKKIWTLAGKLGYGEYFIFEQGGYITDDHYYVNKIARIPMINIIHLDETSSNGSFYEHWHTVNDNLDQIDQNTLKIVGEVVLNVIYKGI
ncbi:MAG: M28 family peptidase [Bacteroidales bacterium]|nr:M28 family peptidase [Bacteroidales bacterium]